MKASRSIVPALLVLTVLVVAAVAIGLMGRGEQGQQNVALVDDGPNAALSNEELMSVAITNMRALKSYHLEFTGGLPHEPTFGAATSTNLSMSADIQRSDKGSRFTMREQSGGSLFLGMPELGSRADALVTANNEGWYESYDSGATWGLMEGEVSLAGFLVIDYGCIWGPPCTDTVSDQQAAAMIAGLALKDGSPRTEQQDGEIVRHIVAELNDSNRNTEQQEGASANKTIVSAFEDATASPTSVPSDQYTCMQSADFWVTTGITPTIRQWRVGVQYMQPSQTSTSTCTLTWKWSRFNEDFGEIKPPPTETVK